MSSIGTDLHTQVSIKSGNITPIVPEVDFIVVRAPEGTITPLTYVSPRHTQPTTPVARVTSLAAILTQ